MHVRLEDKAYWKSLINMGLTKFFILRTLESQPLYGYAILERLAEFTRECCTPTYGAIYPILKEFVRGGYATVESQTVNGRKRKVYELTAKGRRAYRQALETWHEVLPYVIGIVEEALPDERSASRRSRAEVTR